MRVAVGFTERAIVLARAVLLVAGTDGVCRVVALAHCTSSIREASMNPYAGTGGTVAPRLLLPLRTTRHTSHTISAQGATSTSPITMS